MSPVKTPTLAGFFLFTLALSFPMTTALAWELQWFGQSAFKITTPENKVILIDPFISQNPVTPEKLKNLDKLGNVDLVLVTHGHGDHLGDTADIVKKTRAKVGVNADMGQTLGALELVPKDHIIGFNKSGSIQPLKGITVTMVRAEHSSEIVHENQVHPGGEPAGFIIELENGYRIYHAGDTGVFSDMRFIAGYYQPDLALLPIGGHYTMDPAHAAYAVKNLLKTKTVIPMHYGTFPPLKGTPEAFKNALGKSSSKVIIMKPGEIIKF
ncbi:MAG TPA: metal-dependent hydrolase [Gammaproteobacteria bacterium]